MRWDGGGGEMKWSEKKWNKGFIIFAGIHFSRLKETSGDVTNDEGISTGIKRRPHLLPPPPSVEQPTSNSVVLTPRPIWEEKKEEEKRKARYINVQWRQCRDNVEIEKERDSWKLLLVQIFNYRFDVNYFSWKLICLFLISVNECLARSILSRYILFSYISYICISIGCFRPIRILRPLKWPTRSKIE